MNSSGGYPLFVQLRPSNIDAAAGGEEILKDLSFTGYEPDFRIPESFSGEIQAPRPDAVLNVAGAAENPLYRRIWLATQVPSPQGYKKSEL